MQFPVDFHTSLPLEMRRRGEDAFVDELFGNAPMLGASLLAATFPRIYIDANRALDDIDPADFTEGWVGPANPSPKTERGTGLIWTRMHGLHEIYDQLPSVSEVKARIENYWRPYHSALAGLIDDAHRQFGCVYHIDCHSMRSQGNKFDADGPVVRPDFVLGDRDGHTCEPAFTALVAECLHGFGYSVDINIPYKGAELVRRYSDPAKHRHSLQIEVNRGRYMEEITFEKTVEFDALRDHLTDMLGEVRRFVVDR
jgi:N-formylglutamate amidohydrolase